MLIARPFEMLTGALTVRSSARGVRDQWVSGFLDRLNAQLSLAVGVRESGHPVLAHASREGEHVDLEVLGLFGLLRCAVGCGWDPRDSLTCLLGGLECR
jgi:hypothetical protein